ncbi:MAG: hypothetical protein ABMA13_21255 [Chthoniobacteraceae bacterium]
MSDSAAGEILQYERAVTEALRRMARRTHYEPASVDTPLSALVEGEDGMLDEWGIRNETIRKFFEYLTADGPEPWQIMRRLYAAGSHMMQRPFCDLNLREKSLMFGDSHGAQHWRMKRMVIDPLMRNGARSIKAPGMKSGRAAEAAAVAATGNNNRAGGHAFKNGASGTVAAGRKRKPKTKTKH